MKNLVLNMLGGMIVGLALSQASFADCSSFQRPDGLTAAELSELESLKSLSRADYALTVSNAISRPSQKFYRFLKHVPHYKMSGPWWVDGLPYKGSAFYLELNEGYTQDEVDFIRACFHSEYTSLYLGGIKAVN